MDVLSSPTRSLLSLPPEILTRVFDYLGSNSPETSRTCLFVSKRLYEIALPSSVHTYCPRWIPEDEQTRYENYNQRSLRRPLLEFVEYVTIAKPLLAKHVRHVRICDYTTMTPRGNAVGLRHGKDSDRYCRMLTEALLWNSAKIRETQLYTRFCDNLQRDLRLGSEEAELYLLLAVCPRIEDFCFGYSDYTVLLGQFVRLAGIRLQHLSDDYTTTHHRLPLHNLRSVYHESSPQSCCYEFPSHSVMPFFYLPSVKSYECVLVNADAETGYGARDAPAPNRSSSVRDIWIRGSCIIDARLRALTIACKSLRSFEYSLGRDERWKGAEVMPREILHALLLHKETLEFLHINQEDDVVKHSWKIRPEKHVLGFEPANMRVLTTLVVGMQSLTGHLDAIPPEDRCHSLPLSKAKVECPNLAECLPTSLERLEIHHCTTSILDQVQPLLDSLCEPEPQLSKLTHIRLLFLAELTKLEDIRLRRPETTLVNLEILYQTKKHREFDLLPLWNTRDHVYMFTRLYNPTNQLRKEWLEKRGTDKRVMHRDFDGVYVSSTPTS